MKNLIIQIMILASICMIISQGMEIFSGPTISSISINMLAFALFGIGIWGLHQRQTTQRQSTLSLVGTVLLSIGAAAFVVMSIQIIQVFPDRQPLDFVTTPIFMIAGSSIGLGTILFSISVIRINHFPKWTGILLLMTPLINIATEVIWQTTVVRVYLNLLLSVTIIYMSSYAIQQLKPAR